MFARVPLINFYKKHTYEPVYFEVVASELIFRDKLGSPWDRVTESEKRPIEWIINKNEFEKFIDNGGNDIEEPISRIEHEEEEEEDMCDEDVDQFLNKYFIEVKI